MASCSVPAGPGKSTSFSCGVDASQLPDGPVSVCAIAADAAVPNNASSANQTGSASQANLSDSKCDTVVLDRQGPTLAPNASKTTVQTGEQVTLSAEPTDPVSGVDPTASSWDFGDGRPATPGGSVNRSFDQPGTYVATFRARDKAGNESSAQKSIKVEAPPTAVGTPSPGGGTPTPAAGTQIGAVRVTVPKAVRLGRARQLLLRAQAEQAGTLTLRLTPGKKVYSSLTVGLSPGATKQRLRLPKGLKAGTYSVRIAFRAKGAGYTAKVVVRK